MFTKFFNDFDRPSKKAISAGWSPYSKIWNRTRKGRETTQSISIVEGSKSIAVERVTPREITLKIRKAPPTIITVHSIYPSYREKIKKAHYKAIAKMARMKRKGFRKSK